MHLRFDKTYVSNNRIAVAMIVVNSVTNDSRVLKTASSLSKFGYRVHVFGLNTAPKLSVVQGFPFEVSLIANPRIEMKKSGRWWLDESAGRYDIDLFLKVLSERFAKLIGKTHFDVLHTHDMYGLPLGARLRENCSVGTSGWIHDLHEYVEGCTNLPDFLREHLFRLEEKHISEPQFLTTVSPTLSQLIADRHKVERPSLILNTPRLADFDPLFPRSIRRSLGISPEKTLLVYNGGVKPARGVNYAIEVLPSLPDAHLALLTDSSGKYMDTLQGMAKTLGVANRVHTHPCVRNHEVTSFVRDASIGLNPVTIYPNSDLALPNKVFEYVHAGLPVASTSTSMMSVFVADGKCGATFAQGDIQGLKKAIEHILLTYPSGLANASQGSELAARYCWEQQEIVLAEAYAHILENTSPAGFSPPMRSVGAVLHLPVFAANQPKAIASGLIANGVRAVVAAAGRNPFAYKADKVLPTTHVAAESTAKFFQTNGMEGIDTFHYHAKPLVYKKSLRYPTGSDIADLKRKNKRVFFHFRGSEARLPSIFRRLSPHHYIDEQERATQEGRGIDYPFLFEEDAQIYFRQLMVGLCDGVFVPDPELQCYVPNSLVVPRVLETTRLPDAPDAPPRLRPLIVHAPSRSAVKGTKHVLSAIEALRKKNISFDFALVENMDHQQASRVYREADIIVDQLLIGWYGVLAVEAMSMGKAVVSYVRHDLRHYLPHPPPLAYADPDNLVNVLTDLLTNADSRLAYQTRAKKFVSEYHNATRVGEVLIQVYSQPIRPFNKSSIERFKAKSKQTSKKPSRPTTVQHVAAVKKRLARQGGQIAAAGLLRLAALLPRAGHQLAALGGNTTLYALRPLVSRLRRLASALMLPTVRQRINLRSSALTKRSRQEKKRICLVMCIWQRPELTGLILAYYQHLKQSLTDVELDLLAVGSEGSLSRDLVVNSGFTYFEHPNSPLSAKWNFALRQTRHLDSDGVVLVGSDDLLSLGVIEHYADCLKRGDLFVGFLDGYFLDLASSCLLKWNGYAGPKWRARRMGETIGMGRMLARPLLEMLDFSLWNGTKADSKLDQLAQKQLIRLGMLPLLYHHKLPVRHGSQIFNFGQLGLTLDDIGGCMVDVKTSTCITPMKRYEAIVGSCTEISSSWSFLARYFPNKTVEGLRAMACDGNSL